MIQEVEGSLSSFQPVLLSASCTFSLSSFQGLMQHGILQARSEEAAANKEAVKANLQGPDARLVCLRAV